MHQTRKLPILIEASFMAVLAFIFALVPLDIGTGYEVELGMAPIIIFAYRRGLKYGLLSGFIWGIIKLVSGDIYLLSYLQVFIEYVFAFALAGMAGILSQPIKNTLAEKQWKTQYTYIILSIAFAVLCKYGVHFIAGVIYWSDYAPDGMNAYLYSLIVNGSSAIATFIGNLILVVGLIKTAPRLIKTK